MKDFKQKADNAVFVASAIGPWGILMLIVGIVGLVKCCVTKPPDLSKESINKSGNIVEHVMVLDSTNNGFRVVYATAEAVTNEKYEEIRGRPHIRTRFDRLKIEAPKHFGGSLLIGTTLFEKCTAEILVMLYISTQYTNKCETILQTKLVIAFLNRNSGIKRGQPHNT